MHRAVRPHAFIWLLALLGCGSRSALDHPRVDAPSGAIDAAVPMGSPDAARPPDAGDPPAGGPVEIGRIELPESLGISDLVATVDGDACIGGDGPGTTSPDVLEVGPGEGFIACFTPRGRTRATTFACRGAHDGVTRLATNARGDVYALVDRGCVGERFGVGVLRFGRGLDRLARTTITSDIAPGPYVRALAASNEFVVVGGSLRVPGRVAGGDDRHGPMAAILGADDLTLLHVEAAPAESSDRIADVGVGFVAVRDGAALLFGHDMADGRFEPRGGSFVVTMSLPGAALEPVESRRWGHKYGLFWHRDGRPVVLGTTGTTRMQIQVGDDWTTVDTSYSSSPDAAFRGDELLVVRPLYWDLEIAGRSFSPEEHGGFLVGLDPVTFEPVWARGLPLGYGEFHVAALPDGTIAVLAIGPYYVEPRRSSLLFYR